MERKDGGLAVTEKDFRKAIDGKGGVGEVENAFRMAFAGTGWKVEFVMGFKRPDCASVVLESPDGNVLVNAGTTRPWYFMKYGREYVFECAAADMTGKTRPRDDESDYWCNAVGYLNPGCRQLDEPKWYADAEVGDGCLTSSVEEFALKLAAFGWSERVIKV